MEGIMDTNTLDTPLVNTPGRLAIKNGRVHMLKPRGYGSWPVIIPGENVEILYEDQLVTGPKVIDDVGVRTKTWTYKSGGSPCIPTRNE
ncbi:MAG: hypothetical protein ACOYEU_10070 [Limnochordia bacterium]